MNQPTEDRIKKIEECLDKVETQLTEPIKLTIERRQYEVESTLEKHTELLKEQDNLLTKIYTDVGHAKADIGQIKYKIEHIEAEVLKVRGSQADQRDQLRELKTTQDEHTKRFDKLETTQSEQGAKLDLTGCQAKQ